MRYRNFITLSIKNKWPKIEQFRSQFVYTRYMTYRQKTSVISSLDKFAIKNIEKETINYWVDITQSLSRILLLITIIIK